MLISKGYLQPASLEEQAKLEAELIVNLPGAEFIGAFKIEAGPHRTVYDALRATMEEQRGEPPLEQELWHGTGWGVVPKILRQGFNRSFAGRHGTLLGTATYFSTDLSYSYCFCDKKGGGKDNTKVMFLARVLVGSFCKGSSSDKEPPLMDSLTGDRYDSTVDKTENPTIFAVFRDFQAVPLFLVNFEPIAEKLQRSTCKLPLWTTCDQADVGPTRYISMNMA